MSSFFHVKNELRWPTGAFWQLGHLGCRPSCPTPLPCPPRSPSKLSLKRNTDPVRCPKRAFVRHERALFRRPAHSHPAESAHSENPKRPSCTGGVAETLPAGPLKPSCLHVATERARPHPTVRRDPRSGRHGAGRGSVGGPAARWSHGTLRTCWVVNRC